MIKGDILGIDPNEIVLHEIRRHPIGLVFIYGIAAALFVLLLFAVFLIAGSGGDTGLSDTMLTLVAFSLGLLILAFTYIIGTVYRTNELIITNENLVQILQQSMFDRKISQLNLAKVQDVTVDQEGFMATIFGYGTINIETAGEAANYRFPYTPNPNIVAKYVIEAHEQYIRTYQIDGQAQVRARMSRPGNI